MAEDLACEAQALLRAWARSMLLAELQAWRELWAAVAAFLEERP